jgi:hypothetical protein
MRPVPSASGPQTESWQQASPSIRARAQAPTPRGHNLPGEASCGGHPSRPMGAENLAYSGRIDGPPGPARTNGVRAPAGLSAYTTVHGSTPVKATVLSTRLNPLLEGLSRPLARLGPGPGRNALHGPRAGQ